MPPRTLTHRSWKWFLFLQSFLLKFHVACHGCSHPKTTGSPLRQQKNRETNYCLNRLMEIQSVCCQFDCDLGPGGNEGGCVPTKNLKLAEMLWNFVSLLVFVFCLYDYSWVMPWYLFLVRLVSTKSSFQLKARFKYGHLLTATQCHFCIFLGLPYSFPKSATDSKSQCSTWAARRWPEKSSCGNRYKKNKKEEGFIGEDERSPRVCEKKRARPSKRQRHWFLPARRGAVAGTGMKVLKGSMHEQLSHRRDVVLMGSETQSNTM